MITAIVSFGAGFAIGVVLILIIGVCLSATHADRLADRVLGPASSDPEGDAADDDFALSVAAAIYDYGIYGRWHP